MADQTVHEVAECEAAPPLAATGVALPKCVTRMREFACIESCEKLEVRLRICRATIANVVISHVTKCEVPRTKVSCTMRMCLVRGS